MLKVVMRTVVVVIVFLCVGKIIPAKAQAEPCGGNPIIITEIQTSAAGISGTTNFRYEFLEIYNCTATKLALDGYSVSFKNSQGQQTATVALHGELEAEGFLWVVHNSYKAFVGENAFTPSISFAADNGNLNALAADGGTVVLTNAANIVLDTVVFGAQATIAPAPPAGQSIKRCMTQGSFAHTNNNAKDFVVTALPTLSALFKLGPACATQPEEPAEQEACSGLSINEILPNPAGSDEGREFIELYNPSGSVISLKGCSLRLGETGKTFQLPHETLQPGAYRIFSDSESGLTLPNKTGDTVWLLSSTDEQGVKYADNLAGNQAWALIDTVWKATYQVTPLAFNKLLEELPGKGALESEEGCAEGQERDPGTNHCRKIVTSALQPCKPGQERSVETNRCRTIAVATSGLAPCQPGQERNPATNRCRRVVAADDELKPCPAGQERNPETNRCRKIVATHSAGLDKVQEVQGSGTVDPRWWLAGVAAIGVAGYGLYEWRHDIAQRFGKLKQKAGGKK